MEQEEPLEVILKYIYHGTHSGSITDMDTCQRKPYLVTCSREDQSLRLWNYRTRVSIATKMFTSESQRPMSCSIDPNGNVILVVCVVIQYFFSKKCIYYPKYYSLRQLFIYVVHTWLLR